MVHMGARRQKRVKDEGPTCQVFLDGQAVLVPWQVESWYALRGALGVPRGMALAHLDADMATWVLLTDGAVDHAEAGSWWSFTAGECYRTVQLADLDQYAVPMGDVPPEPRQPWDRDSDWWRQASSWA